jgi:hypothetical protein
MSEFTLHVLEQARHGAILEFDKIAQGVEEALDQADDDQWDAIGLSIIETLVRDAQQHGLEPSSLYARLGPQGRGAWEDLYAYLNPGRKWPDAAA